MAIKGIDLGNYNLKTSDKVILRSAFSKTAPQNQLIKYETIEYNDIVYYMGEGDFNTELRKYNKDMLPMFLYALAKKNHHHEVNVVLGLPAIQFNEDKEDMAKKYTGEFNFKLNGKRKVVHVNQVKVFPEGVGAFYTLSDEEKAGDVIIIDIGGRTVNLAWFRDGKLKKVFTVNHGVFNIYDTILATVNPSGTRVGIDMEYIERSLKNGSLSYEGQPINLDFVKDVKEQLYDDIQQVFHIKEFPVGISKLRITGGGADLMGPLFEERHHDAEVLENNIFANAEGFEIVGEILWPTK